MNHEYLEEANNLVGEPPAIKNEVLKVDELDLKILEALLTNANINYTDLAKLVGSNEKAVSRRIERLVKTGAIRNYTIDINWRKLGFEVEAIIGIKTGAGDYLTKEIRNFFDTQPRIIKAIPTIGTYEYILYAIARDALEYRAQVCVPLEPMTADCSTSLVAGASQPINYSPLLNLVKKNNNFKEKLSMTKKMKKRGRHHKGT